MLLNLLDHCQTKVYHLVGICCGHFNVFVLYFAEEAQVHRIQLSTGRAMNVTQKRNNPCPLPSDDYVCNYSRNVLRLGLFNMVLEEMVSTPNRHEALSILKHAMLYFKSSNVRSKYANEILRLLVHQICIMSQKEAQLEFDGMFINTLGKEDSYIATDLQMEYIVNIVKKHIKHMQSGQTVQNIQNRSTAICGLQCVCENFDETAKTIIRSTKHKHVSDYNDVLFVVSDLQDTKPFNRQPGRFHKAFPNITANVTDDIDASKLHKWLFERSKIYATELGN